MTDAGVEVERLAFEKWVRRRHPDHCVSGQPISRLVGANGRTLGYRGVMDEWWEVWIIRASQKRKASS